MMRWQASLFMHVATFGFGVLTVKAGIRLFINPTLAGWLVVLIGSADVGICAAAIGQVIWPKP